MNLDYITQARMNELKEMVDITQRMMLGQMNLKDLDDYETEEEYLTEIGEEVMERMSEIYPKESTYYPNMRYDYLSMSENPHWNYIIIHMYQAGELLDYLKQVNQAVENFWSQEQPKMMKAWNILDENSPEYPTMCSALREILIHEVIEKPLIHQETGEEAWAIETMAIFRDKERAEKMLEKLEPQKIENNEEIPMLRIPLSQIDPETFDYSQIISWD